MSAGVRVCRALAALALLGGACTSDPGPAEIIEWPRVTGAAVGPGPHNVLSAVVTATLEHADSVAVRYGIDGAALDSLTPTTVPTAASVVLPVLGLLPATPYALQVVAWGHDSTAVGDTVRLVTGTLPADLPAFTAAGSDPRPGFVAFALNTYGLVVDNTGRVVWYRVLSGPTLNFQPQSSGRWVTHPVTAAPGDLRAWHEFDALGNVTRTFGCAHGLKSRFHDLITEDDGSYWVLCDETRAMDLSADGGDAAAQVTATVVQHVLSDGVTTSFEWNAFDHFLIADLELALRTGPSVNFTHANALDFDDAGHLLLSFRSLSELTSIDTVTGAVQWRMGGRANQFAFGDAPTPFMRQHGLRHVAPGVLQVLDNLGQQDGSRVEVYTYSASNHTASRVGAMAPAPAVTAVLGGATQRLAGGRILAAYGNGNRVQEYDAAGHVVRQILGDVGYVYRATRVASLYRPGHGTPR